MKAVIFIVFACAVLANVTSRPHGEWNIQFSNKVKKWSIKISSAFKKKKSFFILIQFCSINIFFILKTSEMVT